MRYSLWNFTCLEHEKMKKYLTVIVVLISILSCQDKFNKNEVRPTKSNITESVYASVKISPIVSYSPQPLRSGIIEEIYVNEGDVVEKGQILFQILPTSAANSQLLNAEINLQEAKSNYLGENNLLNNIELEIESTKEQLSLDLINLKRQERLLSQNIGRKVDFDQVKLKYDNTRKQLELLNQKYLQTKTTLRNNYRKAVNNSKTEKADLKEFQITAEMAGKVYSINKEEGDFISGQETFAEIGSYEKFKIEMDIDEVDITKVELGDSVLISLDAYVDELFLASISKIYPKKNDVSQTFRVESEFLQQPPKLYYGLAGEANIIVSKRRNTIIIPTEYLMSKNRVLTTEGEVDVKVGMKNLDFVEILSGIDTSTSLLKPEE